MKAGLVLLTFHLLWAAGGTPPKLLAESAVLLEQRTGAVLYAKNARKRMYPASLTKLLTALVVVRSIRDLSEPVTVSEEATKVPASSAYLKSGERLAVRELLEAALVRSANDACVALTEHVAGSVRRFASLMNFEARQLGCENSHFVNPHGLHDPRHYSCALDLAKIARAAMSEPVIRAIVREKVAVVENLDGFRRVFENRNKLLWRYRGADGVKTGFTKEAGRCLIGSATREGMRLIAVVLKSPDPYADCEALFDWGFSNFRLRRAVRRGQFVAEVKVEGGRPSRIPALAAEDGFVVVWKGGNGGISVRLLLRPLKAPVLKGQVVGRAVLLGAGRSSVPLVAAVSSDRAAFGVAAKRGALLGGAILALLAVGLAVRGRKGRKGRRPLSQIPGR